MKKILIKFAAVLLAAVLCVPVLPSAHAVKTNSQGEIMVRVGLASTSSHTSTSALEAAHLENVSGYGAGYRFGYYDDNLNFVELGRTGSDVTQAAVLKTTNLCYGYSSSLGKNTYSSSITSDIAVGCYHLVLPGTYGSYQDAAAAARAYSGGFPAWINGSYQARVGAYSSKEAAQAAQSSLGLEGASVAGTSSSGMSVVKTGTAQILFQFDDSTRSFGILPDVTGAADPWTWFSGYMYRDGFQYQRVNGGNITVVNVVDLESYVKGVAPYEIGGSQPLEAVKAQAICARTYVLSNLNGYNSLGFDVSNSTYSQVYYGLGNSQIHPTDNSDRAVNETAGLVVKYNGKLAQTPYSSSHGGASEDAKYIWGTDTEAMPYLKGVIDPYEATVASMNSYSSWTVSYTAAQLMAKLQSRGLGTNTSLDHLELTYSNNGNVIQVKVYYTDGGSNTITPRSTPSIRSAFGVNSIHFTVNGKAPGGASAPAPSVPPASTGGSYAVNGSGSLSSLDGAYVISGTGTVSQAGSGLYTITGKGTTAPAASGGGTGGTVSGGGTSSQVGSGTVSVSGDSYVFQGAGWGHQVGMSQFGAIAMAKLNFTCEQIITFYFPGTAVTAYR